MKRLILAFALLGLCAQPALARSGHHARTGAVCGPETYVNVSGHCVHRPMRAASAPPGASAQCRDGSYSFSEHHRGTCSHHGGVAAWLR